MLGVVERVLSFQLTIVELICIAVLLGGPYLAVGIVWASTHTAHFDQLQGLQLTMSLLGAIPYLIIGAVVTGGYGEGFRQAQAEQGSDALVTLVASIVSWPVLLFSHSCAT